jgi:hypothetical protein
MVMPIAAGFLAEGSAKWKQKGPFNLGQYSKLNAVIAVLAGIILAITGFFPPNEKVFHFTIWLIVALLAFWSRRGSIAAIGLAVVGWLLSLAPVPDGSLIKALIPDAATSYVAIGVAVLGAIITYLYGGEAKRFEGVPEGEQIAQRQKMIAEIEKKYGEA